MIDSTIEGIESLRIMRADANCSLVGGAGTAVRVRCDRAPELRRINGAAEIFIASNATVETPPSVAVEVLDCAGNLEVDGFKGNLALGRIGGNLSIADAGAVTIRGRVGGNCNVRRAAAIDAEHIGGNLSLEGARSLQLVFVAGNLECAAVEQGVSVDEVGGKCVLDEIGGKTQIATVGGKFAAERVGALDLGRVGGKLRISECSGDIAVEMINGRLVVDGAAGALTAGSVDGQAALRAVGGNVELRMVRGAVNLRGPFPPERVWHVKSGGRISVELPGEASVELDARARFGRVRLYGVDGDLHWSGRDRLSGKLGEGKCKLALETTGADIILEGEEMVHKERERWRRHRDFGFRWGRHFGAPFESLAENLGEEIPEFVSEIVGAAGKFVSETGAISGGLVREVARGVTEGLRDVERSLSDLERVVPDRVADKLAGLGRQIRDLVTEAVGEGRSYSQQSRREAGDRIRRSAEELGREVREAVREARERWRQGPEGQAFKDRDPQDSQPDHTSSAEPQQPHAATGNPADDKEIFSILQAVKAGRLSPEEADDLIKAWSEVKEPRPN